MLIVSAAVAFVAILIVSVPLAVTPPISIVFVVAASPKLRAVTAPPMFSVVTVASKREAVVVVEVMSALVAPFTPKSSAIMTDVLLLVKVRSPAISSIVWATPSIAAIIPD